MLNTSMLPPNQQLAAPGKWPVVGEKEPRRSEEPWTVNVSGRVTTTQTWTLAELLTWPQDDFTVAIHCVTRWSKPNTIFRGFLLARLLDVCGPLADAHFVSFVARSERHHSTSIPLADALALQTIVAFQCDGQPLEPIHGGPIRTVVPGRYFYKSLKWLERIELLTEDRLGYWERDAGYHNRADVWREERYIAPDIDRRRLKAALETGDFSNSDWRGLDARNRSLLRCNAHQALLRDANFQNVNLRDADFTDANLSNAHLEGADLRGASFHNADVEGANFRQADLRGTDFTGASLFGATFCPEQDGEPFGAARLDSTTRLRPAQLDALTPTQQQFVKNEMRWE